MLAFVKVEVLWKSGGKDKFNVATYGKLFNYNKCCIVTADEDGVVRIFEAPDFNSISKQQTVQELKVGFLFTFFCFYLLNTLVDVQTCNLKHLCLF